MLIAILIVGIISLLLLVSIFVAMTLGLYKDHGEIIDSSSDGVTTSVSAQKGGYKADIFIGRSRGRRARVSMELWEAVRNSMGGDLKYAPIVLFFIFIHLFMFLLVMYFLQNGELQDAGRVLMYGVAVMIPLSAVRQLYRSYRRVSANVADAS